jgi:phosphatidylserine/phosphatidylglycerophosphate/cardiolipin synthase-like enzyme
MYAALFRTLWVRNPDSLAGDGRGLRRIGVALLAGAALAALIVGVVHDGARARPWPFHPSRLIAATIVELAVLGWSVYLWAWILACFAGPQPAYQSLLRAWRAATLAKYLPGSIWPAASTVEMAARIGASPVALPSAFVIHAALNLVGALTVGALFGGSLGSAGPAVSPWLAATGVFGALALVHPRVVNAVVARAARVARLDAPAWEGTWAVGATLLLLSIATWVAYGAAFALFLSSLAPTARVTWLDLAGINALAFTAGFVAFFAPGGIGVREAALVALLGTVVPGTGARFGIAASSRLWLVLTEIVGGMLVVVAGRQRRPARVRAVPGAVEVRGNGSSVGRPPHVDYRRRRDNACATVLRGVRVDLLTDTRDALAEITSACGAATRSIWIAQLAFDADCVAQTNDARAESTLLETIAAAARRLTPDGTPLDVRIVLNGGLLLDTSPALRRAIAALGAGANVQVRTVKAFPQVMHAKVLVVDGAHAFLMSASFVNGYWDDARHAPVGAPNAGLGVTDRPLHDVAVRLRGAAVSPLVDWFADLWSGPASEQRAPSFRARVPAERAGGIANVLGEGPLCRDGCDSSSARPSAGSRARTDNALYPDDAVRILRTMPNAVSRGGGRMEILDAYLDAIGRATSYIYLESQYFSSRPIARAVSEALDARPELEVIVVLNQNPDVTAYRAWQDARLAEHRLLDHPRVGVFALWSTAPSLRVPGRTEITQVFVHSKVAVIDDSWATLGTANLDGASLHAYGDDFARWPGRRVFGAYRNYDLNVALLDGVDGEPRTGVAASLRQRLWARHLGLAESGLTKRPADGWLPTWRARAADNVRRLVAGGHPPPAGRALPYVPCAHPRAQLRALGIDVEAAGLDLRFDPSWLDVRWNAGWVKKMFPERVRRWL